MSDDTPLSDLLSAVEAAIARTLTGANATTATDKNGQYITRDSAYSLAEFIGTDVVDAVISSGWRFHRLI